MLSSSTGDATLEEELESLLDRQRLALNRLWAGLFFLVLALSVGIVFLARMGALGWVLSAMATLLVFVVLSASLRDYRAAHEAVLRRVARR